MRRVVLSIFVIVSVWGRTSVAQVASWTVVCLDPNGSTAAEGAGNTATKQVGSVNLGAGDLAALWDGTAGSFLNLNPSGSLSSRAHAAAGTQQAGARATSTGLHAVIWAGTSASYVDMNPSGAITSVAFTTTGSKQAGMATFSYEIPRAARWTGTAGSYVSLNPSGASTSTAYAATATQQGGWADFGSGPHAGIWTDTAGSFVDLNPSGVTTSYVYAMAGTQQAGVAGGQAAIWSGTAASRVNLNPAGATSSAVYATTGTWQAGCADVAGDGVGHACVWKGTAASFVDLDVLLPAAYRGGGSWAKAILVSGRNVLVVGGTFGGNAILWQGTIPDLTIKTFFDCNDNGVYEPTGDDKLLGGWQFEVRDPNGVLVGTYTTDPNGQIVLSNLTSGNNTLTAIVKKDHYVTAGGNPRVVSVTVGGDGVAWFGVKLDADVNQDGLVDSQDFTIIKANFGMVYPSATWTKGNVQRDSIIDSQDFSVVKGNFGKGVLPNQP